MTDEQRLTRFGEFLPSNSQDKLLTLCNVMIGDKRLNRPRPFLVRQRDCNTPELRRNHGVLPAILKTLKREALSEDSLENRYEFVVDESGSQA